ncbi:MAG: penicillin-binding protein [Oscillospiraceae bacterium]|nr:penicillin-binding protein [Oscillospiraceae bacterium]
MNRIAGRATAVLLLVVILLGGLTFFLCEFTMEAKDWVLFNGSPHLYNSETGRLRDIYTTDRDGTLLLDLRDGRTYASDSVIRQATLHWTGDQLGNISVPFYGNYLEQLAGFDYLNGLYAYGDPGAKVELTISAKLQTVALEALGSNRGTVAIMNYETGEILCAVSNPSFDPENAPEITEENLSQWEGVYLNRFTQATYVPGSIFKIVTLAAALETIQDIESMTFQCTGKYQLGNDWVTCEAVHGTQDLKTAFARSCNCAFAQIALLIGEENLSKYIDQFGVTEELCFDGITTEAGSVALSDTADVELAWSAIGQHKDQINPARYLAFLASIARGGVEVDPHIVRSVSIGADETYQAQTGEGKRIMSVSTAETLRQYLRNNVQTIYGPEKFGILAACGKSGTAEVGGGQKSNALFTGFTLDEDYPLAFIAVVENGGYGSNTCIPILAKVLDECVEVLEKGS